MKMYLKTQILYVSVLIKMTRVPQIPSRKGKSQNSRTGKHSARIPKPRRKSREQEYYIDESRPATSRTGMSTARSNVSKRSNFQEYQLTGEVGLNKLK